MCEDRERVLPGYLESGLRRDPLLIVFAVQDIVSYLELPLIGLVSFFLLLLVSALNLLEEGVFEGVEEGLGVEGWGQVRGLPV